MLGRFRRIALALGDSLFNVRGRGHVDGARFVVPIQRETLVTGDGPLGGDHVEWREGVNGMLGVFAARALYYEVVNSQTEESGTGWYG